MLRGIVVCRRDLFHADSMSAPSSEQEQLAVGVPEGQSGGGTIVEQDAYYVFFVSNVLYFCAQILVALVRLLCAAPLL